jgi:replicative DNA helicase
MEVLLEKYPDYTATVTTVTLAELVDIIIEKEKQIRVSESISNVVKLCESGDFDAACSIFGLELPDQAKATVVDESNFDVRAFIADTEGKGSPFGIAPIDESFGGFKAGQLITLLGRQKSCKSTLLLNSAIQSWRDGYSVLFFSVEMNADLLKKKIYAIGAKVSQSRLQRNDLHSSEWDRVNNFQEAFNEDDDPRFHISEKHSVITVEDVRKEIKRYTPHVVYIDGFNFMYDPQMKAMTTDWKANENVSAALKSLCLDEEDARIVVAAQVQEKQYTKKLGVEAASIMAGTGLLKASDLMIGLSKEGNILTLNCPLSRYEAFDPVKAEVDWNESSFLVIPPSDVATI